MCTCGGVFYCFLPYFWRQCLSVNLEHWIHWQPPPASAPLVSIRDASLSLAYHMMLEIWTQVLMLTLSTKPSPSRSLTMFKGLTLLSFLWGWSYNNITLTTQLSVGKNYTKQISSKCCEVLSLPWFAKAKMDSQSLLWMWKLKELSELSGRLAIQSLFWAF